MYDDLKFMLSLDANLYHHQDYDNKEYAVIELKTEIGVHLNKLEQIKLIVGHFHFAWFMTLY